MNTLTRKRKKMKASVADAWSSFSRLSLEKRAQAELFVDQQERELKSTLEELSRKASRKADHLDQGFRKTRDNLEEKRDQLYTEIRSFKHTSSKNWESAKQTLKSKWQDLDDSLDEFVSNLKN